MHTKELKEKAEERIRAERLRLEKERKPKTFNNPEYTGVEIRIGRDESKFYVCLCSTNELVQVSEEVFDFLRSDSQTFRKKENRYYQRCYSVDAAITSSKGNNYSSSHWLEANYSQMLCPSAEEVFYEENRASALRSFIKELGDGWLDLYNALFILEIPASEYAKQIGLPASTVRSRKAHLKKEIRNFLKNL